MAEQEIDVTVAIEIGDAGAAVFYAGTEWPDETNGKGYVGEGGEAERGGWGCGNDWGKCREEDGRSEKKKKRRGKGRGRGKEAEERRHGGDGVKR